jgi:hypothetical protein
MKIEEDIKLFIKKIEKKNLSLKAIKEKEIALDLFLEWTKKEKINDLFLSKKQLSSYRQFLFKKNITEKNADSYLKTINHLIKYVEGREKESDLQKIINHYFKTKGYTLEDIKKDARKKKIVYSRYTRPAKDLLLLTGSVEKALSAITKVAVWANSRNLDYAIETVFKKWPEINKLKPKEKESKPFYRGDPMIWSKSKKKWYVIDKNGDWLEFAGEEKDIQWKDES